MSEENKPEVEETGENEGCCGGHGHKGYEGGCYGHHGPWSHGGGWMRKRMMMSFASMTVEEEIELLESVKVRLENRLKVIDERLSKLKA